MKLVKFVGFDGCWCNLKKDQICLTAPQCVIDKVAVVQIFYRIIFLISKKVYSFSNKLSTCDPPPPPSLKFIRHLLIISISVLIRCCS